MTRIPTHRSLARRIGERIGAAVDKHPWIPLVVAIVALLIINSPS